MPYSSARVRPTSSKRGRRRATSTRFNSLAASWRANSLPMPEDAPVTRAQGPNVFVSMRLIEYSFFMCLTDLVSGWDSRDQSVIRSLIAPAPGHGKLNLDDYLVQFGRLERLDEDLPSRPSQLKMVLLHPGSQPTITSFVVGDAHAHHRRHGFNRWQGADRHRPTVGEQN